MQTPQHYPRINVKSIFGVYIYLLFIKGRTIRKVMGGVGNFQLARIFFSLTACAGIFFSGEPLCTNFFFFRQILLFFEQ